MRHEHFKPPGVGFGRRRALVIRYTHHEQMLALSHLET